MEYSAARYLTIYSAGIAAGRENQVWSETITLQFAEWFQRHYTRLEIRDLVFYYLPVKDGEKPTYETLEEIFQFYQANIIYK